MGSSLLLTHSMVKGDRQLKMKQYKNYSFFVIKVYIILHTVNSQLFPKKVTILAEEAFWFYHYLLVICCLKTGFSFYLLSVQRSFMSKKELKRLNCLHLSTRQLLQGKRIMTPDVNNGHEMFS